MHNTSSPASAPPSSPPPASPLLSRKPLVAAAVLLLAGLSVLVSKYVDLSALFAALNAHVEQLGVVRGGLLLAAINYCTVLFCFPANMGLMIGAGAVLGPLPAFLALFTSKLAAAATAFALARGVLHERATRWLERAPKLKTVLADTGKNGGWKFVVLMRLSPFPGFLLNYLLSLTGVGFSHYLLGTVVGIAPSISNLVLVGATAKDVGIGVGGGSVRGGWLGIALKVLCSVSMIVVSIIVTKKTRKAFAELDENGERKELPAMDAEVVSRTAP